MATSGLFKVIAGSNNKTQVVMITRATIVFSSDILLIMFMMIMIYVTFKSNAKGREG